MPSLNSAHFAQEHFACIDMVRIDCTLNAGQRLSESAILLEIWAGGGLVQTSFPITAGSTVVVAAKETEVTGEVTKCEQDSGFGYLVDIAVNAPTKWFPSEYVPQWHAPALDSFELETVATPGGGFVC
jgi:hypothetical protein